MKLKKILKLLQDSNRSWPGEWWIRPLVNHHYLLDPPLKESETHDISLNVELDSIAPNTEDVILELKGVEVP